MVVCDFNVVCLSLSPIKTDAPSFVYSNTPLTASVAEKSLEVVPRRRREIEQRLRLVQLKELSQSALCEGAMLAYGLPIKKELSGFAVPKAFDHLITPLYIVKR